MNLSWSAKRQLTIIIGLAIIAMIIASFYAYPRLVKAPTCTDSKQNGTEHGVDCGGPCSTVCPFEANPLQVVWARAFPSIPNNATAVAYIDNKNTDAGVMSISYEFKLFDDAGRITTRDGQTFIGAHGASAIVESRIPVGNRVPTRATFDFTSVPTWTLFDKAKTDSVTTGIVITQNGIEDRAKVPKLSAMIKNTSFYDLNNLDVVAIVYNIVGDAIAVSASHLFDPILKQSSKDVFFTWSNPLLETPGKIEIIPRVNPFTLQEN